MSVAALDTALAARHIPHPSISRLAPAGRSSAHPSCGTTWSTAPTTPSTMTPATMCLATGWGSRFCSTTRA
eukprot:7125849-Prymnesium_polylepis.1